MYAFGSFCQPLHLRIQPGWPPPDALPARGTASPKPTSGDCGYSVRSPTRSRRRSSRRLATHRVAEADVGVLRILGQLADAIEALLVAQLDAAQVEDAVLHRGEHLLALA